MVCDHMVNEDDIETATTALRMVIAGLAAQVIDHVALPEPGAVEQRIAAYDELARLGRDIALAADTAAMALRRSSNVGL